MRANVLWISFVATLLSTVFAGKAIRADRLVMQGDAASAEFSRGIVPPTVEMWFYDQERQRRKDPREMIREKAEFRARQRQQRVAALKWYGFSNSRPQACASLFGVTWSPVWIGNTYDPYAWRGTSATTTVLYVNPR